LSVQDDGKHDPSDAPFNPLPKCKRAKFRTLAISASEGTITIEKPASIDRLPYELRLQIIGYVENDAYTLLNLLLVSKIWYLTLMQSEQAEKNWERLCRRMNTKRKAKGHPTWHSTFIYLLHKYCVVCLKQAKWPLGKLLVKGFRFIMVCHGCQWLPGPMHLQPFYKLAKRYGLNLEDMVKLPRLREIEGPGLLRHSELAESPAFRVLDWRATLDEPVRQLQIWSEDRRSLVLQSCPSTIDEATLSQALEYSRKHLGPSSCILNRAIVRLKSAEVPEEHLYASVVAIFERIREVLDLAHKYVEAHGSRAASGKQITGPNLGEHLDLYHSSSLVDAIISDERISQFYLAWMST
jgi:hypothetical protein